MPASSRGFDGGKKINGRKRHIVVDTTGLLPAVMVTAANVTDREAAHLSGFVVLPRRWVVERTFGWLMRSRRLTRDYERRTDTSEAMVLWSMTMVMSRRLAKQRR